MVRDDVASAAVVKGICYKLTYHMACAIEERSTLADIYTFVHKVSEEMGQPLVYPEKSQVAPGWVDGGGLGEHVEQI